MNVSLMPFTPQNAPINMGILNSEKIINQPGSEAKKNGFEDYLGDFEKKGKQIDPSILKNPLITDGNDKKNPIIENINIGNLKPPEKIDDKELDEITKKLDPLNKLESNELFLFQRELANKTGSKNDSIHTFSKLFNVEKKEKKPEVVGETVGNVPNNNKNLEGIIKENQVSEQTLKLNTPKELFNWISKVISKSQIKAGETLNLQIRDKTLGEFNISAQNGTKGREINMAIVSQTKESDEFFKANEKDLIKSLENAGVKVGKIEILTTENSKSFSNSESMSDNKGSLSESIANHFAQRDQLERDGQRRREIWNRFRDLRES